MRLVLVDNDQAALDLIELDLRLEGHDIVATATTGEAALELCAVHRPDVLVVDFRLGPGINGLDVVRQLAAGGPRAVLFTNYVNPSLVVDAASAGAVVVEKGNLNALRRAVAGL